MNRRHVLLATQGLVLVAAAALRILTFTGLMNATLLRGFSLLMVFYLPFLTFNLLPPISRR